MNFEPYVPEPTPRCSICSGWALRSDPRGRCGSCVRLDHAVKRRERQERIDAAASALVPGQGLELSIAGKVRKVEFVRARLLGMDFACIEVRYWTASGEARTKEIPARRLIEAPKKRPREDWAA